MPQSPNRPRLSRVAAGKVRELREEHGVEPTLDEIIWLHELGRKVENPVAGEAALTDLPIKVGNVYLWPLSVSASIWLHERALPWFEHSPILAMYAMAFAMAHGRGQATGDGPKTLQDLMDRDAATAVIHAWASMITCTRAELEAAMDSVLDAGDGDEAAGDTEQPIKPGVDWLNIVNELAVRTGTDPEYWKKGTSRQACIKAYLAAVARDMLRGGHSARLPGVRDAVGDALQRLQDAVVAIVRAHKETPCA